MKIAGLTIVQTMTLVGLLGLTMHLEFYWMAGVVAAIFLFGIWASRRAGRRERAGALGAADAAQRK